MSSTARAAAAADGPTPVEVTFTPLRAHVRTARVVAAAVARRCGVVEPVLDEVRLAVGEACARAVSLHERFAPAVPVRMQIEARSDGLTVTVTDVAPAQEEPSHPGSARTGRPFPSRWPAGGPSLAELDRLSLALVVGLVDAVVVQRLAGAPGTRVQMSWPLGGPGLRRIDGG